MPLEKAHVKDAPGIDADGELSDERGARALQRTTTWLRDPMSMPPAGNGHDTSGPTDRRRDDALRGGAARGDRASRERPRAPAQVRGDRDASSARCRVRREEVRVEREPITEGNVDQALDGPEISEEEHEVVLHEERPVVEKEVVAKERVRLSAEERTDEETVSRGAAQGARRDRRRRRGPSTRPTQTSNRRRTNHGYPEPIRLGDRQRQGAGAGEGAGRAGEAEGRRPAGSGAHA